ncbi:hypothetical protein [Shimazuella kribbensis]|uniref:hypothetical protein n=1 Tax=Shimazuella kribbensis TaxID=139808 RepID=UPI0004051613|nr:hypothetical protein [Shimazuella kribbensis]
MAISYGSEVFTLAPGTSVGINTAFGGNTSTGGNYLGPIVVAAAPIPNQRALQSSTVATRFTSTGDLTSKCVYDYAIQNNNSDSVSFKLHFFHN